MLLCSALFIVKPDHLLLCCFAVHCTFVHFWIDMLAPHHHAQYTTQRMAPWLLCLQRNLAKPHQPVCRRRGGERFVLINIERWKLTLCTEHESNIRSFPVAVSIVLAASDRNTVRYCIVGFRFELRFGKCCLVKYRDN